MKLPFQTLAVLLFFVGSPIGLMQLTTNAIESPKTYPLMSVAPSVGFAAAQALRHSIDRAVSPNRLTYRAITELVGKSTSLNRFSEFVDSGSDDRYATYAARVKPVDGLIVAAERALMTSVRELQPTFVALPSQLKALHQRMKFANFRSRAIEFVASNPIPARSPVPNVKREIPGLIRAAQRAMVRSWNEIQPAIAAFPGPRQTSSTSIRGNAWPTIPSAEVAESYRSQTQLLRRIGSLLQLTMDNR